MESDRSLPTQVPESNEARGDPSRVQMLEYAGRLRDRPAANPNAIAAQLCGWASIFVLILSCLSGPYSRITDPIGLLWVVLVVVAISLGIVAIRQTRNTDPVGRSRAKVGIRTACVSLLLVAVPWALVSIIQPTPIGERANRVKCASNLRQIGQGIMLYANDNGGRFPDDLGQLIIQADLNPEVFVCPSSNDTKATGSTTQQAASLSTPGFCSYVYLGTGLKTSASPQLIIAYEQLANHEKDGINVLYGDGQTAWIKGKEAERIIKELNTGHNPPRAAGK